MRAAVAHQSCDQMFQRRKVSSGDHITARGDCPARVQPEHCHKQSGIHLKSG
jgi:hypothetical protein